MRLTSNFQSAEGLASFGSETDPADGTLQKSVFVDRKAVMGDAGGRGKVRVLVLRKSNAIMAILPSPERDIVSAFLRILVSEDPLQS